MRSRMFLAALTSLVLVSMMVLSAPQVSQVRSVGIATREGNLPGSRLQALPVGQRVAIKADAAGSLTYGTLLGRDGNDYGRGVALDENGSLYVVGDTASPDFPTTAGAYNETYGGGRDAFLAKFSPDGTSLVYSTFLGGKALDIAYDVAVDENGSAYVVGKTESTDFPTTVGANDTSHNGGEDVFVLKVLPNGSDLEYSTLIGGSGGDTGVGIGVDVNGSAYVAGSTSSADFPTTIGAFDTSFGGGGGGNADAFATKVAPDGDYLEYSTFIGHTAIDYGIGLAVDVNGSAYVVGATFSSSFPTTPWGYDTAWAGSYDAFVVKMMPNGTGLSYGTFLGGNLEDRAQGVAVDAAGAAYVTGKTKCSDFPTVPGSYNTTFYGNSGVFDGFALKLLPNGSDLVYGTFLGSGGLDQGLAVDVDDIGSASVAGTTYSAHFPVSSDALNSTYGGSGDAFHVTLSPDGSLLTYGTFLGGAGSDVGAAIAVDENSSAYVAGDTAGSGFPVVSGSYNTTHGGNADAFALRQGEVQGPNLAILSSTSSADLSENFTVFVNVTDQRVDYANIAWVNISFGGVIYSLSNETTGDPANWTWSLSMTAPGSVSWFIVARTTDGLTNQTASRTLSVGDLPNVWRVSGPSKKTEDTVLTVSCKASDSRSGDTGLSRVRVRYRGDWHLMEEDDDEEGLFAWSGLSGDNQSHAFWTIRAYDNAGNTNSTSLYQINVTEYTTTVNATEDDDSPDVPTALQSLWGTGLYWWFAIGAPVVLALAYWASRHEGAEYAIWWVIAGVIGLLIPPLANATTLFGAVLVWGLLMASAYFVSQGEMEALVRNTVSARWLCAVVLLAASVTSFLVLEVLL